MGETEARHTTCDGAMEEEKGTNLRNGEPRMVAYLKRPFAEMPGAHEVMHRAFEAQSKLWGPDASVEISRRQRLLDTDAVDTCLETSLPVATAPRVDPNAPFGSA